MSLSLTTPLTRSLTRGLIRSEDVVLDPNIKVLLDAQVTDSIKLSLGKIFEWEDQTINGNNSTQVIVSSQPTLGTSFGKPGVKIDSTDDYMVIPFTFDWTNDPFTILVVGTKLNLTGFRGLIGNRFGGGSTKWWTLGQHGGPFMTVERTVPTLPRIDFGIDATNQPPQIYEFRHDPNIASLDSTFLNGTFSASNSVGNIGGLTNELRIGRWVSATQGWDGFAMEIQVRTELFDAAKRASVTAALSAKWQ